MAIETFSAFYYGHEVTTSNYSIDFDEGGPELNATIAVGFYSLTDYLTAVKTALDAAGANTYTVTVNRNTRLVTISATGAFDLLFSTGANTATTAAPMLGFATADFTAGSSYVGTLPSGSEYRPQFLLQDYIPQADNVDYENSVINKSANGTTQIIRYNSYQYIEMNLKFITDIPMDHFLIKNNPTGVQDARNFLGYCIKKGNLEFIPDVAVKSTFTKVVLESTTASKDGIAFKLKENIGQNLPGIYETGKLEFRVMS